MGLIPQGLGDVWATLPIVELATELTLAVGLATLLLGLTRRMPGYQLSMPKYCRIRRFEADETANATLDFVLTFPIFTTVVLVLVQLALLINAQLVVSYSAYAACRSAVVWLQEGERVAKARAEQAAEIGCLPISPGTSNAGFSIPGAGLANALPVAPLYMHSDSGEFPRRVLRGGSKLAYSRDATSIEIELPAGDLGPHDPVTVSVEHQFYLSVPYGDFLFRDDGVGPTGLPFRTIRDTYTLTHEGRVESR